MKTFPMELPFKTPQERGIAIALVVLWALLFLPNLRTNPNWYGDEGVCMENSWTLIHGHPRLGALRHDFLVPNPYPPVYLTILGTVLQVFGYDIFTGRMLQVATALATVGILFWIGTRLRNKYFGFLCGVAFLVYPEVVMHYRWVRMHPMAGTFALASCGFLVRYIQEKRMRDIAWAGAMCSLATGCHPFTYPLIGLVIVTALLINWRHTLVATVTAGAFGGLFVVWFVSTQPGGWLHLVEQVHRTVSNAGGDARPTFLAEIARMYRLVVEFCLLTPTVGVDNSHGVDLWLVAATLGALCFPVVRFRQWLVFWMFALVCGVLRSRSNVPMFFYPAMCFVPLMAIGFAGAIVLLGDLVVRLVPRHQRQMRAAPGVIVLGVFGIMSLSGSLGHFRSKIDPWTLRSPADAEAAMRYVTAHTVDEDFVIMPDQVYWLFPHPYRAHLIECAHYTGKETQYYGGTPLPHDQFWFDCSWQRAKYLVLAYGMQPNGRPYGIDAVFWMGFKGVREIIEAVQKEKWPIVFQQGEYMVLANPRLVKDGK